MPGSYTIRGGSQHAAGARRFGPWINCFHRTSKFVGAGHARRSYTG